VNFGNENIFVFTGVVAPSRTPNVTAVANHRSSIRNTNITLRASRAIGLR
jgi:hypothetical protein